MLDFTLDILLIGFVVVLITQLLKAPIKAVLEHKGLKESAAMSKAFNATMTFFSYAACFAGACIYFVFVKHIPVFADAKILTYTVGVVGSSQSIYKVLETYGRDGILAIVAAIIERLKQGKTTNVSELPSMSTDELAEKLYEGIQETFEGANITVDDVKRILEAKIKNHS